uniref:Uncharacterized protein n=1 Tax=Arundo donax TaxID=35708 RepID=A0A0A9GXF8_ARUDO
MFIQLGVVLCNVGSSLQELILFVQPAGLLPKDKNMHTGLLCYSFVFK